MNCTQKDCQETIRFQGLIPDSLITKTQGDNAMTFLTWCDCGEDMGVHGGRECVHCGVECCLDCIEEHEKYCEENPDNEG